MTTPKPQPDLPQISLNAVYQIIGEKDILITRQAILIATQAERIADLEGQQSDALPEP